MRLVEGSQHLVGVSLHLASDWLHKGADEVQRATQKVAETVAETLEKTLDPSVCMERFEAMTEGFTRPLTQLKLRKGEVASEFMKGLTLSKINGTAPMGLVAAMLGTVVGVQFAGMGGIALGAGAAMIGFVRPPQKVRLGKEKGIKAVKGARSDPFSFNDYAIFAEEHVAE